MSQSQSYWGRLEFLLLFAVLIEGGLAGLAMVIGYFIGYFPCDNLRWHPDAIFYSLLATIPLVLGFAILISIRIRCLIELRKIANFFVVQYFRECSFLQIVLVCGLAGIGEELFFRGLIQGGISNYFENSTFGIIFGIAVASFLFAAGHALTRAYYFFALFTGIYFGLLYIISGNLLVPIISHAIYDYLVIWYFLKLHRKQMEQSQGE